MNYEQIKEKVQYFFKLDNKKRKSAFAGILLASGITIYSLIPNNFAVITGEPNSGLGKSIATSDLNNDGTQDLLIGQAGTDTYKVSLLNEQGSEINGATIAFTTIQSLLNPVTTPSVEAQPIIEIPVQAQNDGGLQNTENTPAPSVPVIEQPPATEMPPTSLISRAYAQTVLSGFGLYVQILPDLDGNGTKDFMVNSNTTSYVILNDINQVPISVIEQTEYIAIIKTTMYKASDQSVYEYTFDTNHQLIKGNKIHEQITDFDVYYDYRAFGTTDDTITIQYGDTLSTISSVSENSFTETIPDYGSTLTLIPDIDKDDMLEIAVGYPSYDNNRGLVIIHLLKRDLNNTISIKDTFVIENPTDAQNLGLSLARYGDYDKDGMNDIAIGLTDRIIISPFLNAQNKKGNTIKAYTALAVPYLKSIYVTNDTVTVRFDQSLATVGNTADFVVKINGIPSVVTANTLTTSIQSNDAIALTLTTLLTSVADVVTVEYTYSTGTKITNTLAEQMPNFTAQPARNRFFCVTAINVTVNDCIGLLYIKEGFLDNTVLTNWGINSDVSTWLGITTQGSRAQQINLSSKTLTGILAEELGMLTALTTLNVSDNTISGSFPYLPASVISVNVEDNNIHGTLFEKRISPATTITAGNIKLSYNCMASENANVDKYLQTRETNGLDWIDYQTGKVPSIQSVTYSNESESITLNSVSHPCQ